MPYFNHTMARSIKKALPDEFPESSSKSLKTNPGRVTRSLPGLIITKSATEDTKTAAEIYRGMAPSLVKQYRVKTTIRKLLFAQSLMSAQTATIEKTNVSYDIATYYDGFADYIIYKNELTYSGKEVVIYGVQDRRRPKQGTVVRVYARQQYDPQTSVYLKIVRYLAYKHPYIVHTFELFDNQTSVYVFQEWATGGSVADYVASATEPLAEEKAVVWARQLERALDYLGDMAIAHRDLAPKHLLLQVSPDTSSQTSVLNIKLSGFKKAVIYWNSQQSDINYLPCVKLPETSEALNFQPPEVFGDPATEQYDPILADAFSYGAVVYFMLTKAVPFKPSQLVPTPSPTLPLISALLEDIEEEIRSSIYMHPRLSVLGTRCCNFLRALLRTNANDRMPFDFVESQPWLQQFKV